MEWQTEPPTNYEARHTMMCLSWGKFEREGQLENPWNLNASMPHHLHKRDTLDCLFHFPGLGVSIQFQALYATGQIRDCLPSWPESLPWGRCASPYGAEPWAPQSVVRKWLPFGTLGPWGFVRDGAPEVAFLSVSASLPCILASCRPEYRSALWIV